MLPLSESFPSGQLPWSEGLKNRPSLTQSPLAARDLRAASSEVPLSRAALRRHNRPRRVPLYPQRPTPAAKQALSNEHTSDAISPFVVGVSGHRDLRADAVPHLRAAVTEILLELKEHLPDSELRIMAGMASGADLLVVQAALDLGVPVDALLPMPLEHYAADFDAATFALLKTYLANPLVTCRELPLASQSRSAAGPSPAR